jgi:hypothetical protein
MANGKRDDERQHRSRMAENSDAGASVTDEIDRPVSSSAEQATRAAKALLQDMMIPLAVTRTVGSDEKSNSACNMN